MAADELIHIYSGSFLNAQFIANVLNENNIKCMVKDDRVKLSEDVRKLMLEDLKNS